MEGVGFTELSSVENPQSVLGLLRIRVCEEDETEVSIVGMHHSPLVRSGFIVPRHIDAILVDDGTCSLEHLTQTIHQSLLLRFIDDGDVVEDKNIFKSLLGIHGVSGCLDESFPGRDLLLLYLRKTFVQLGLEIVLGIIFKRVVLVAVGIGHDR